MNNLVLSLHLIICVLIVMVVLLQSGKEGMGVILGGSNTSVFGSSGASGFLSKLTTFLAIIFIITSLSYTIITKKNNQSTILDVQLEETSKPSSDTSQ